MNVDTAIKRIKVFKHLRTDKQVAALLGISPQELSNRKKRGTLEKTIAKWAMDENVVDQILTDRPLLAAGAEGVKSEMEFWQKTLLDLVGKIAVLEKELSVLQENLAQHTSDHPSHGHPRNKAGR